MTAQLEEIIVDPHLADAERLRPNSCQPLLNRSAGRCIRSRQLWPDPLLLGFKNFENLLD